MNSDSLSNPLTVEHRRELSLAKDRSKAIRKAARVATFNGWATAVFAVFSIPFALFSVSGFLLTVALGVVAYNEFRGRRRLLAFTPSSTALLGWNQLGLLAVITVYSLWMLSTSVDAFAAELRAKPELQAALGSLEGFDAIYRQVVVAFYALVIGFSAIFQGLNALYYFTRRKYIDAYLRETPAWVRELELATSAA